jgi:two-component system LytT family sensor kinase
LMEATSVTMAIRLVVPWREEPAAIEPQDEAPRHEPRRGRDWIPSAVAVLVFVGGWPLIYSGYMRSITATFGEDGLPRWFAFFASGLTAVVLTLTIVTAVEMSRRFPWWDRSLSTGRKLLAHIGAALAMAGVHLAVKAALIFGPDLVVVNTPSHWAKIAREIAWSPIIAYMQATAVLFIVTGVWRRVRADREALRVRAEMNEAERRRAESELRALQAELNPHFLGNALHTVASLIRTAPDEAVQLLHELQHLLRVPMGRSGTPEITLAEELALLEPYLAVERARIRRPLDVSWMVDQDALRGRVPQMILQPLVENAVKHGFARDGETARIEVAARRVGTRLEVSVSDDGAGLSASRNAPRNGNGVGVSNTRARLRELYGDQATLELAAREEGGTVARISVPWREVVV